MPGRRVDSSRLPAVLSACAGTAFLGLCSIGLWHSYTYDESVTVGFFVRQSSFVDAVTSQHVFNNHPLLTAINWVVYQLGGDSEAWQRAPAVAAGVTSVIVVVLWCARRWGMAAGIASALVTATNPLLVTLSTQARGYSFAALAAAVSTTLVVDRASERSRRGSQVLYAACVALGLLAHLYVGIVFIGHGALVARRGGPHLRSWLRSAVAGGLIASAIYVPMLPQMASAARSREGSFVADFPRDVAVTLFGQPWAGALVLVLVLGLYGLRPHVRPLIATVTALIGAVWLVLQPFDLYPRFLVWAVPLIALTAAALTAHNRAWVVPSLFVALACVPAAVDRAQSESDIRAVAVSANRFEARGVEVCAAGFYWESFVAYGTFPPVGETSGCELIIVRSTDLESATVRGLALSSAPGASATCFAGSPTVLMANGLRLDDCNP